MKHLLFFFFLSLTIFSANATHIVGGEIGYKCLDDQGNYEITLTVYRDCYYGIPSFDTVASVGFFIEGIEEAVIELRIDSTSSDTLNYQLDDPCLSIPPDVCVEVMQYVAIVNLPYQEHGYTIVYQRCCRNETLLNIQLPLETGASFVTVMTGASMLACNSSPVFTNWPPLALCVEKMLDFDHSAIDEQGDSLVYSVCAPFVGAHHSNVGDPRPQPPEYPIQDEVVWINPPYDETNMLGGVPLTIDPQTGQLTAIPSTIGQFVVGICMEEYRDGKLLSVTKRDFQFNVSDCGEVVSSFFAPNFLCDELSINFDNLSQNALGQNWDFGVDGVAGDTSNLENPTFMFPDTGQYTITLISTRSETCVDTFVKTIYLQMTTFDVGLDWDVLGCGDSLEIQVMDQTVDSVFETISWSWELSNDVTSIFSEEQNPHFTIPAGANTNLHGLITSSNGCEKEIDIPFTIAVIADLSDSLIQVCRGDNVVLNPNPVDTLTYNWYPDTGLDNPFLPSPTLYDVQEDVTYSVEVNDLDSICKRTFNVEVIVLENSILTANASPDTIFAGETSQLSAMGDFNSYVWSPAETLNFNTIQNPIASPSETTDYLVVGTNSIGCPDTTTLKIIVLNPDCDLPNVFVPSGFTPNNDGLNDYFKVYGFIVESMQLMVFDRWGEKVFETNDQSVGWDGTFKGKKLPAAVYGFYVRVNCINGEEYIQKGNVTLIR